MAARLGTARLGRAELGRAYDQVSGTIHLASFEADGVSNVYFFAELGAVDVECLGGVPDSSSTGLVSSPLWDPSHSY